MILSFINARRKHLPLAALIFISLFLTRCSSDSKGPAFVQTPLPYAENALEPYMSAQTLSLHYGKHHAAYVKNANTLVSETSLKGKPVDEIIRRAAKKDRYQALFNQAAQAWNHDFFWQCLSPSGGGEPEGNLLHEIKLSFGSFEKFKDAFLIASNSVFGSGWVWLVKDEDHLLITTTSNADTPLAHGLVPLFGVDVWEHSYYLDYQNKRADYVKNVLAHLANWEFVSSRLEAHDKN